MVKENNKPKPNRKSFIEIYNSFLKNSKIYIIILWVVFLGISIYFGPKLFGNTEIAFDPPESAPSKQAQLILETQFPNFANDTYLIILIRTISNESISTPEVESFCTSINNSLVNFEEEGYVETLLSYFFFKDLNQDDLAETFVSEDYKTTMIVIMYNYQDNNELENRFIDYVESEIEENKLDEERFETYLTGMPVIYREMFTSAVEDLALMDSIVIPIALVVLAYVLRRLRLLILPMLAIAISTFVSFALLYFLTYALPIVSFAPSIVMSLVIALAIDYALFLLTRFREEIEKGVDEETAVNIMTEHAGHTILVSGITLTICFIGLIFFPVSIIATMGISAAITVAITLLTNLTLLPALLLTFKRFFSKNEFEKSVEKRFFTFRKKKSKNAINKKSLTKEEMKLQEYEKQSNSIWTKITKSSQKYAPFIIIVVFIAAIPISIQVINMNVTMDMQLMMPRRTSTWDSYNVLQESFPAGQIDRHFIIIETAEENGILNPDFFTYCDELIMNLTIQTMITGESFQSITWTNNLSVPFLMAVHWLNNPTEDEFAILYNQFWTEYTNADNSTALFNIITPFDPYGQEEEVWVKQTRDILDTFEDYTSYNISLAGKPVQQIDALITVMNLFPYMIIVVVVVVYIFIAVMFKSLFIPLRLIITIGLTISWIFGLAVLIYEKNIFDWIAPNILGNINMIYWLVPVLSFTVVLGLGLDYDIFLLSRISEYRRKAFSDKAAIVKGVYKTGGIITAAGVIMAIAFSGLMLSSLNVMNPLGFILCFAVLVDTFIIRTILVPAIMSIADKANWWPAAVPIPTKEENYMDDDI